MPALLEHLDAVYTEGLTNSQVGYYKTHRAAGDSPKEARYKAMGNDKGAWRKEKGREPLHAVTKSIQRRGNKETAVAKKSGEETGPGSAHGAASYHKSLKRRTIAAKKPPEF
jgi:hypothetical protein